MLHALKFISFYIPPARHPHAHTNTHVKAFEQRQREMAENPTSHHYFNANKTNLSESARLIRKNMLNLTEILIEI